MTENEDELKQKNLKFFEEFAPEIHSRLLEAPSEPEQPHIPLAVGEIPTYRFTIPAPTPKSVDRYTFDFLDATLARAKAEKIPMIDWPRSENAYFLIILGIHHQIPVSRLIEQTQCLSLIFIEPDMEAMRWSLRFTDWENIISGVQGRGGTVDFILTDNAEHISATLWRTIRSINPVCADGTTFASFAHPELAKELSDRLINDISLSYTSLGFFYDESLMIWNAYKNLTLQNGHIFERRLDKKINCPVFVVASGPSLDDSIAVIKSQQDDAVIISCGSALRPLLLSGITPDFQIETENAEVSPLTLQMARDHDLSKVILVAATTIDSDVLPSFRDIVFFFRSSLSAYPLFSPSDQSMLFLPDPTVGNAGASFALECGFQNVYLFGMDCGSRTRAQHHSKSAYHYTEEAGAIDIRYDIPIEGNFGEQSWTNIGLMASISNFAELFHALGIKTNIYNCSDGALIPGTKPLAPADFKRPKKAANKTKIVQNIVDGFPHFLGEEQAFNWMGDTFRETIHGYGDLVRERLQNIEDFTVKDYQIRLMELFQPQIGFFKLPPKGVNHCVNILMRGTLFGMLLFFEHYLARVANPSDVQKFGNIAFEELSKALALLERDAVERLGGPEPLAPPSLDTIFKSSDTRLPEPLKPSRNSPCPCGSTKKYKHCHGSA